MSSTVTKENAAAGKIFLCIVRSIKLKTITFVQTNRAAKIVFLRA
jgi:hypothetical protein